jgi:acyl-CoA thioesterase-1
MKQLCISLISIFLLTACSSTKHIPIPESQKTEQTILALGDSITAGYGLPETDAYPAQLEVKLQSLGYNYRVQNA